MLISKTPLRISFAGGGTDIRAFYGVHGGAVISAAIDKYVYVALHKRFDGRIRIAADAVEEVERVGDIRHDLVRAVLEATGIRGGVDIAIFSDIPSAGTGLGSSSALTVGLLNACHRYQGRAVSQRRLAEQACEIEIDVLQAPIGKQDQYAAALGGLRHYAFHRDGAVDEEPIRMAAERLEGLQRSLLLFYTGITRSASAILRRQTDDAARNMEYWMRIKAQCETMRRALEDGTGGETLGAILHEGWEWKKRLADGITTPAIDEWYGQALRNGATGGKIAGAGGGGFLLLHAEERHHAALREKIGLPALDVRFDRLGTRAAACLD
ncbi:GHMP kinase [Paenibacillus albicereus]|uniref:GHMP kinase n=1 Tax=Paenibacillus albicereus TaxID=2726185 RepID=A0A6H2H1H2_9BACL|nr:GHMP kinase [Paenibacillus albicereus]QJC53266.1 GHMP kinase [Paenibacillus albicereus]